MELLKLVIVDDEPILLQGLLKTYDWEDMGFKVVGSAISGENALEVIRSTKPHVVLTDIRMKQMTGLMVMDQIQKGGMDCLFIVLSAYRDFEYAQQACDLGAFAYLLKPIEDGKLRDTMQSAYNACMKKLKKREQYETWERLLMKDATSFLQTVVQKYAQNQISLQKAEEIFRVLGNVLQEGDRFIAVWTELDITYKITNPLECREVQQEIQKSLEEMIAEKFFCWKVEGGGGNYVFIIKTQEKTAVRELKQMIDVIKEEKDRPIIAVISKPYKGVRGIRRCFEEAQKLFGLASISGTNEFTISEERTEKMAESHSIDVETLIVNAVRKNHLKELKDAFIRFIYSLPNEEELQCQYMHKVMLKTEFMLKDSYGMTEELKENFQNYYSNLQNLNAARSVDVCYKILHSAIVHRKECIGKDEAGHVKEYMTDAISYIEEHLDDENLTIVSVATHIYLNSVYFGRVFKNTFHMTFKQYLMQQRMEKAKQLLEKENISIGSICEQVGINNPSYFSHLFKQYTGKLPSEYKKEYEI